MERAWGQKNFRSATAGVRVLHVYRVNKKNVSKQNGDKNRADLPKQFDLGLTVLCIY